MTLVILGILAVTWTILSKLYDGKHYRNSRLMATLTIIGLIAMIPIIIAAIPVILAIGLGILIITLLAGVIGFAVYGFIAYLTRR
jgi:hypothetical protein